MAEHYHYNTQWSSEDREFVGLCEEFPSLSHLSRERSAALSGIHALVGDVVADMVGAPGEPN